MCLKEKRKSHILNSGRWILCIWGPLKRRGLLSELLSKHISETGIQIHSWSKSSYSFYCSMHHFLGMEVVREHRFLLHRANFTHSVVYAIYAYMYPSYMLGWSDSKLLTCSKLWFSSAYQMFKINSIRVVSPPIW